MELTKINKTEDILKIKPYLDMYKNDFSDLTCPNFYMWKDIYPREYCIFEETLIIREVSASDEKFFRFYLPVGKNIRGATELIEKYCLDRHAPLIWSNLTLKEAEKLALHYHKSKIEYNRDQSDYVYSAEDMRTFKGKKFAGQRNHINKFKNLYGEYEYHQITSENLSTVKNFLIDFAKKREFSSKEEFTEYELNLKLSDKISELGCVGGFVSCNGSVIAVDIGEIRGNTLYVCAEKADRNYQGTYQIMVQEFAKHNTNDTVCFINREDDMGSEGLRTSKLQYQPIEIKHKYYLTVSTLFDKIISPVKISGEHVILDDITNKDKEALMHLYTDDENNKYWGYDYKEDAPKDITSDYFIDFVKKMKETKEEYSVAIRVDSSFAGEGVFHNFDFCGSVELGIRLLPEFQGQGFAVDAVKAMKNFATSTLNAKTVKMKCMLENRKSADMIKKSGFTEESRDEIFIYFTSFTV
ncbi:MAG: GNAT family N-acetyltransferase [Ruminococcaceae bacterium]|nr:GNAT family N-acetyltransferase [Oscillospiraceae bacterium]